MLIVKFASVLSEVPFVTPVESHVALLAMVNATGADPTALATCKASDAGAVPPIW